MSDSSTTAPASGANITPPPAQLSPKHLHARGCDRTGRSADLYRIPRWAPGEPTEETRRNYHDRGAIDRAIDWVWVELQPAETGADGPERIAEVPAAEVPEWLARRPLARLRGMALEAYGVIGFLERIHRPGTDVMARGAGVQLLDRLLGHARDLVTWGVVNSPPDLSVFRRDASGVRLAIDAVLLWCERVEAAEVVGAAKAACTEHRAQVPEADGAPRPATDGDEGEEPAIPAERRTRPLMLAEAARLMGYKGQEKAKRRQLRSAMDGGAVRFKRLTRQRYVFDRNDFPAESQRKVGP